MREVSLKGKGLTLKGKLKRQSKIPNQLMDNGFVPDCKMSASKLSYSYGQAVSECLFIA